MKKLLCIAAVMLVALPSASQAEQDKELRNVKAGALSLKVPASWESTPSRSSMRAAQFAIGGGDDKAELVVFYFGGGSTGGVKANVNRWVGQFVDDDNRKVKMTQGKMKGGSFISIDLTGTWNKPDGPPFARKTIKAPGSRVINVIAMLHHDDKIDHYFLKLSGSQAVVAKQVEALSTALSVDDDSVKPFELKNAPN